MTSTSARLVTIDVQETLRFFDEKPEWSMSGANGKSLASGIVGMFGEDLNAACFQRYMESQGHSVTVRPEPVTTGKQEGPRLDRWITVDWSHGNKTVFQTEIKNWSSHSFDGETLPVRASLSELTDYKQDRWERKWDSQRRTLMDKKIAKVLVPMKLPSDLEGHAKDVRPLLIFWEPIGPRDKANKHLFRIDSPTYDFPFELPTRWPKPPYSNPPPKGFSSLQVFSVSSYLRSIQEASIELEMPDAADRLRILGRLFK